MNRSEAPSGGDCESAKDCMREEEETGPGVRASSLISLIGGATLSCQ